MSTHRHNLTLLSAGILVFLVFLLFGVLWLFLTTTEEAAVERLLAQQTGANVSLEKAERLWAPPGVLMHGLRLESEGYTLEAKSLEARVSWLPMLWGEARAGSLRLSDARLVLADEGESSEAAAALPLGASWQIERLEVRGSVGGQERELFYVEQAEWEPRLGEKSRFTLRGGATAATPDQVRVSGEATAWRPPALPDGRLEFELADFPAQPFLGYLLADTSLLAAARLSGKLSGTSETGASRSQGSLRAATPDGAELMALEFRLDATPALLTLESASGQLAGNAFEADGAIEGWQGSDRRARLNLRMPDARLEDDTLGIVQAALGRGALQFAEDARGPFAANLVLEEEEGRRRVRGHVDLNGVNFARQDLPRIENLRGGLSLEGDRAAFSEVRGRVFEVPTNFSGEIHGRQLVLRAETEEFSIEATPLRLSPASPVHNLHGRARVEAAITGDAGKPAIEGTVALRDAGFAFHQVAVRELAGEGRFTAARVEFRDLEGRAGGCPLRMSGWSELPRWQETVQAQAVLRDCELPELVRLAEAAEVGRLPGLEADALAGQGTLAMAYNAQAWRGELQVQGARWSPAWLGHSLDDVRASVRIDPEEMDIRNLSGRFGNSPVRLSGQMGLLGEASAPWALQLEAHLARDDATAVLPDSLKKWLRIPAELEARGRINGSPQGVSLQARIETADPVSASAASPAAPLEIPARFDIRGIWQTDSFSLNQFTARFGSTELSGSGRLQQASEPQLEVHLQAPPGSSLEELLSFVRLPEAFDSLSGRVAADVSLRGPVNNLQWAGSIELEEARLPALLTDPVQLNGRLELVEEGIRIDSVRVVQPSGEFTLNGTLRGKGTSTLQMTGESANLDRLLGQLPDGPLSMPDSSFLREHPAQVDLALQRVQFLDLTLTDVQGRIEPSGDSLALFIHRFGLSSGRGSLQGRIAPAEGEMRAMLSLNQVPMQTLLVEMLKMQPAVSGPLDLHVEVTGPIGTRQEFLSGARGLARFTVGEGRIQKGTLPERLFALAVLLDEGIFGFGPLSFAWISNPPNLRKFSGWTGTLELEEGKARLVESNLVSKAYDVNLQGELDMQSGAVRLHGEGNFHPPFRFNISVKALVDALSRLFRLARGRKGKPFEFDVVGEVNRTKRIENFRFK